MALHVNCNGIFILGLVWEIGSLIPFLCFEGFVRWGGGKLFTELGRSHGMNIIDLDFVLVHVGSGNFLSVSIMVLWLIEVEIGPFNY